MAEIVSEDVMDWARDLAAIRRLFAGEEFQRPPVCEPAVILQFAQLQPLHRLFGQSENVASTTDR